MGPQKSNNHHLFITDANPDELNNIFVFEVGHDSRFVENKLASTAERNLFDGYVIRLFMLEMPEFALKQELADYRSNQITLYTVPNEPRPITLVDLSSSSFAISGQTVSGIFVGICN